MLCVYGAYVGPMLIHVRLLEAVELVLSQERRVPFKPLPGPEGTGCFWMLGVYGAYVVSMLIHVRLLEAMLGPYLSHAELMLSQERRVPFKSSNFEGVTCWKFAAIGYRFPPRSGFSWVS